MKVKADEAGLIPANVRCMDRILLEPMSSSWGDKMGDPAFRIKKMGIESESWPAVQARVEEIILGALAKMQEADARYQKMVAEQPADYVYETSVPGPAPKAASEIPMPVRFPHDWFNLPDRPDGWRWSPQIEEIPETIAFIPTQIDDTATGPATWKNAKTAIELQMAKIRERNERAAEEADDDEEAEREDELLTDVDNRPFVMNQFGLSKLPCESATNFLMEHWNEIVRAGHKKYGQWYDLTKVQRFDVGIAWLEAFNDADEETAYPIYDWIEWAQNHRA